jgi:hypothetical protein
MTVRRLTERALDRPLDSCTFPWDVPEATIVVEFDDGWWRVVSHGRPVEMFRDRADALERARKIAALYWPVWTIVERPAPPRSQALAS